MGLVAAMAGCQTSIDTNPVNTEYNPEDSLASIDFWHEVADRPICSNNEALHGLILLDEGKDISKNYKQRLLLLKAKGYLPDSFDAPPNQAVQRGTVAQILCHILKVKGGLTMRLIGPHPRYATRELIFLEIFPPCTPNQSMSGIEYVEAISRAESYQEEQI